MATVETVYLGGLRTEATHVQSGRKILTDAPVDNHGKGEAFSPTDLVAAALGSCMMTLMGIAAQTQQIDIDGTRLSITKVMSADPRRIGEIIVDVRLPVRLRSQDPHRTGTCRRNLSRSQDTPSGLYADDPFPLRRITEFRLYTRSTRGGSAPYSRMATAGPQLREEIRSLYEFSATGRERQLSDRATEPSAGISDRHRIQASDERYIIPFQSADTILPPREERKEAVRGTGIRIFP